MDEQESKPRVQPQSDLDLALMTTDSVWGKSEVPPELKTRLKEYLVTQDKAGKDEITSESMWGLLGFYTRDMRLANLSAWNGEFEYCQHHLDLASDFLQTGAIKPFIVTLTRVATVLELSQSKGGFLRRKMHTFTEEKVKMDQEPPKKSLFGAGKKQER